MKKLSVLVALALLAVAGTSYAVTCSQDSVPAATLLVPYFRVEATTDPATGLLNAGNVDTLCAITNVSGTGLIAHVTVWNKYSKPVFDFNVPLSGYDVATWSMRGLLNGTLNVNPLTQDPTKTDVCGVNLGNNTFNPTIGFGKTIYIRFTHPDFLNNNNFDLNADYARSISIYQAQAFGSATGPFRQRVLDSLDESNDINTFTSSGGQGILDVNNPVCDGNAAKPTAGTALTGYVTIDVVNFCTNWFPAQREFYEKDAIATRGWIESGYTPNALMGDVFYLDKKEAAGNISGEAMVGVEYDERLQFSTRNGLVNLPPKTFYARYVELVTGSDAPAYAERQTPGGLAAGINPPPLRYRFAGDGREPLAEHYGFRYMNAAPAQQTWLNVWRSSIYLNPDTDIRNQYDLCTWLLDGGTKGYGFWEAPHKLVVSTYDENEKYNTPTGQGCPSGDPACTSTLTDLYIFLESQRIALAGNNQINPAGYTGGWIDMKLVYHNGANNAENYYNMGYIGVQHTGAGAFVSVGHSATVLDSGFLCEPTVNNAGQTYLGATLAPYDNTAKTNGINQ